ncbi:MAG: thiamine pyrophosphate-binding protein [Dehalococcoidia bacterium]|nr:thiamine pyrophosphate-binding protein [Dehalococcoidia bacterium]
MQMTGGQALVQSLKIEGIETIFALPGIQLDFAFDALWEERDHFRIHHTRHEQATAYMADGFARTTGRVGTSFVVPGPGLLNAAAGLSTAYACSAPVLCITGQIQSDLIGRGRGALHEINDQLEAISSVVKHAERAMTPEEIPGMVRRAFRELHTGRPRPVEIEVPPDVLERVADVTLLEPESWTRAVEHAADSDLIEQAAEMLGRAERPLICAGGGVLSAGAWEELRELSRILEAPVLMTSNGRGAVSDREYRAHSWQTAARELLPNADVILAVGTRFLIATDPRMGSTGDGAKVVQLDIDPEEVGRNREPDLGIVGDAKQGLGALVERVPAHNRSRDSREAELTALKEEARRRWSQAEVQSSYGMAIREELPEDGILVSESTQVGYWCNGGAFPVYEPRTFLTSGYQGTLGYGFATALGAQVGNPDRKVVSINGDGGFMYNVQELSTMAQQDIPLVTVVFNDNAFGNVRRIQTLRYNGHTMATELQNPDFLKLADSFGVAGYRADGVDQFRKVLREALANNAPALIEVPMPPAAELSGAFTMEPLPPRPVLDL